MEMECLWDWTVLRDEMGMRVRGMKGCRDAAIQNRDLCVVVVVDVIEVVTEMELNELRICVLCVVSDEG